MTRNQIDTKESDRMNPEVKALWLDALRGGQYAQGKDVLKQGGAQAPARYCCLGVLCDLHAQQTGAGAWQTAEMSYNAHRYVVPDASRTPDETESLVNLPLPVREWSGLLRDDSESLTCALAGLNDSGVPFSEIADEIERRAAAQGKDVTA